MIYQPYFGLNILVSNEFVALLQVSFFMFVVVAALLVLTAYQVQRSNAVRKGQC